MASTRLSHTRSFQSRRASRSASRRPCGWRAAPIAAAACLCCGIAGAQTTTLAPITITGKSNPVISIGGWGNVPLSKAPFQASVIGSEQLADRDVQRLSDITGIDPAVSDAYNSEGYWDYLTVRGFVIDNRFNYRRDGLPINAETSIPLDNKEGIEVLKGTSGLQAGTSAPGGLVNFVVKRPTDGPLRKATLGWRQRGTVLGAVDISQRFGEAQAFGLRVNAAAQRLDPLTRSAEGKRHLLAVAADWRLAPGSLLEAEFETSHRSQPSVPAFSLLGSKVPAPVDPRINLNNQPWSLPVVLDGDAASLRFSQQLNQAWRWTAHAQTQRLTSQDRIAFPFGCSNDNNYDRYCADGSYDLYDFRSENERRRTDALELALHGALQTGSIGHAVSAGVLGSRVRNRFQQQAYNYVGSGNVLGALVTPADPSLTDENTNRDERSTEFFVRDAIKLTEQLTAWLGLRHTRLHRESVRTNGSRATDYTQSFSTPWLAASFAITPEVSTYASWGKGVESAVAPNRARYTNRGQALRALESRQTEIGIKGSHNDLGWSLAGFDITRPAFADFGVNCSSDTPGGTCTNQVDGSARHRGIEASADVRQGAWSWRGGVQWLQARRQGSLDPTVNGQRPTNVPAATLVLQSRYDVPSVRGLSATTALRAESKRMVLPDNSVHIPGYGSVDTSLRYAMQQASTTLVWRAGIDNVLGRRAWRESPYQFGHAYLFPLAGRTARLSVEASL